jgi:hypothetical protein
VQACQVPSFDLVVPAQVVREHEKQMERAGWTLGLLLYVPLGIELGQNEVQVEMNVDAVIIVSRSEIVKFSS